MRILHVVHQYMPDKIGGTELYTQWVTRAQAQRDHEVAIFHRRSARGKNLAHREEDGVDIWSAWNGTPGPARRFCATWADAFMLDAFGHVMDELDPEVVHIEHLMGLPTALVDATHQRGVPYVITLWDFWWVCANAQLLTNYSQEICDGPRAHLSCARCSIARIGVPWLLPALPPAAGLLVWRSHLLRRVMNGAARLIAPTPFVRDWYAARGVASENGPIVVEPALESHMPSVSTNRDSRRSLRLAYIGGLSWQKGVHILIEAVNRLHGEVELWIAGDETSDPEYASGLRAKATSDVLFLGRLSREAVWETLSRVDVVAVPSLWYETFSFIISEAFAAGVPVVASRLGPLADRVRDDVDGLLVPPGDVSSWRDSLRGLVDEPNLLKRLTANVRPPMTLGEHVDELEEVYQGVLTEGH